MSLLRSHNTDCFTLKVAIRTVNTVQEILVSSKAHSDYGSDIEVMVRQLSLPIFSMTIDSVLHDRARSIDDDSPSSNSSSILSIMPGAKI
jgi:hypothetical protein